MKKKSTVALLVVLAGIVLCNIVIRLRRDSIVINNGIRAYRRISGGFEIALIIFAVIAAVVFIVRLIQNVRAGAKEAKTEAAEKAAPGKLSSRRMDGTELRKMLAEEGNGKWRSAGDSIARILQQMDRMDDYQKSLADLLNENEATALGDTEDILDRVEQNMFRNIRGVLNFMNVADPSDQPKMEDEIRNCIEKNGELLEKTKNFMYALTDYLNNQGSESGSAEMLDTYRETILEALKK